MLYRLLLIVAIVVMGFSRESQSSGGRIAESALPMGFKRVQIASGISSPTAFAWVGSHIYVTEKNTGRVRVVRPNGTLRSKPYVDLHVSNQSERGLLGIAVHPNYRMHPYIYLYYTTGPGALNYTGSPRNRVSRFTSANGVGTNEKIIFDNIPSDGGNHNGGDIHFGFDGKLYIAVGDGGVFHNAAQNLNSLRGKILRINSDGTIPNDNPFYKTNKGKKRAVFAYGFRNPWRFTLRPSNQTYVVADVGQNNWEEVDVLHSGGNFGWNNYEGPCPANNVGCNPDMTNFGTTIPPIHYYNHSGGDETGHSIIGGTFSNGLNYASQYADAYFYGDYEAGWVHVLTMDSNNTVTNQLNFDALSCPVSFGTGPDGNVYVADICSGAIYRYTYAP